MPTENDAVFTLHRYFVWGNSMRTHFDQVLESRSQKGLSSKGDISIEEFMYMSLWYALLYVLIEGWQGLCLSDATIDGMLMSPNVKLLRRYRNGVFHFQKKYYDKRFMDFMASGPDIVDWVRELNRQFGRYFVVWLKQNGSGHSRDTHRSRHTD